MEKKGKLTKKYILFLGMLLFIFLLTAGCGKTQQQMAGEQIVKEQREHQQETDEETENDTAAKTEISENSNTDTEKILLEDGIYTVDFNTDGSMFHVNEACEGKGTLTVKEGEMLLHISLPSKNVINLFLGLASDAEKERALLLQPTIDTVTYRDGMSEEVHGFDIPITVIGEEFDLALLGTKGKWYDHKVIASNPVKKEESKDLENRAVLENGTYMVNVTLEGGSGRATVDSPTVISAENGTYHIRIIWSSPHYDYMKVGKETYYPVNTEGNSIFEFPVNSLEERLPVIADTTAMGTPHEIAYTLVFDFDSMKKEQ